MIKSSEIDQRALRECEIITGALNDLIKRWTFPVIHGMSLALPVRFNELKRRIPGISSASLTERLSELEKRNIVRRTVYPESPPRVEYNFTEKGWELFEVIDELEKWVARWNVAEKREEVKME